MAKARTLTAFLGLPHLASFDEFIAPDERSGAAVFALKDGLGFTGRIYLPTARPTPPHWMPYLNQGLTNPLPTRRSSGVSAVLVVKAEDRYFAFTFGHAGRSMLSAGSYELDFGLKVVLNRVNVRQLRSVDTKNLEDVVISTRKQASRSSALGAFEIDASRDLLRGVVGDPKDKTYFKRIAGSDAVAFTTELPFADLGDICSELLDAFQSTDYRTDFPWVDRVRQIRDASLLAALDDLLVEAIKAGHTGAMHLAPADIVEWEKIEWFSYTGSGSRSIITCPDLVLSDYLSLLGPQKVSEATSLSLRRHQVQVKFTNAPSPEHLFSVYECIVWQTQHNQRQFALMDGRWFEIEESFATRVTDLARSLTQAGHFLIAASTGQTEEDYNAAVAAQLPSHALLDQKMIRTANMISDVECCDLLSSTGQFVHIKKRNVSATLSHLFAQGSVSAELFIQEADFRAQLKQILTENNCHIHSALVPTAAPDPAQFEVVYAIIVKHDRNGEPPQLPFFSAVNLMQHHQRLQRLRIGVSVRYIVLN